MQQQYPTVVIERPFDILRRSVVLLDLKRVFDKFLEDGLADGGFVLVLLRHGPLHRAAVFMHHQLHRLVGNLQVLDTATIP